MRGEEAYEKDKIFIFITVYLMFIWFYQDGGICR